MRNNLIREPRVENSPLSVFFIYIHIIETNYLGYGFISYYINSNFVFIYNSFATETRRKYVKKNNNNNQKGGGDVAIVQTRTHTTNRVPFTVTWQQRNMCITQEPSNNLFPIFISIIVSDVYCTQLLQITFKWFMHICTDFSYVVSGFAPVINRKRFFFYYWFYFIFCCLHFLGLWYKSAFRMDRIFFYFFFNQRKNKLCYCRYKLFPPIPVRMSLFFKEKQRWIWHKERGGGYLMMIISNDFEKQWNGQLFAGLLKMLLSNR